MSIRSKVLLSMTVAFLAVSILLGGFMYKRFDDVLIGQIKGDIEGVILENRNSLDNVAMGIGRSFAAIGFNEDIINALDDGGISSEEQSKSRNLILNECRNTFELSLGSYVSGYALHFYINENKVAAESYKDTSHDPKNNLDFGVYSTGNIKKEKWYKQTMESDASWVVFRMEENPEYIFFAKAIYEGNANNTANGNCMGIGVVGINCRTLLLEMEKRIVPNTGTVAMLDHNNNLVCMNSGGLSSDFIKDLTARKELGFNMSDQIETEQYFINRARSNAGITFVSVVPKDSIYMQTKHLSMVVVAAVGVALIIAFILIYIIAYYLTRPIKRLSKHMGKIDYENLSVSYLEPSTKDEVGELYKAFNTMMKKIEQSRERENEQNEKNRKTQIQMLQAQINPHFLYNVLDSISWLAMENGQDSIGEMADLLSQLFSYSIKDGKIMATLGEELESVKQYVALQKNRYVDNIELVIDACEDCLDMTVPKCILQPLVENSIVHGLDEEDGICITISVKEEDGFAEILVEDNGTGCDIGVLENAINSGEENNTRFHLGIRNVATRLRQIYSGECGLSYIKNSHGGVTAKIILPTEKREN